MNEILLSFRQHSSPQTISQIKHLEVDPSQSARNRRWSSNKSSHVCRCSCWCWCCLHNYIALHGVKFPVVQDLEMINKKEISVMTLRHLKLLADPSDVSTPSCSITNDWKIQCSCDVTKAFSTRDRYSCQWFQNVGGQVWYISNTHCWYKGTVTLLLLFLAVIDAYFLFCFHLMLLLSFRFQQSQQLAAPWRHQPSWTQTTRSLTAASASTCLQSLGPTDMTSTSSRVTSLRRLGTLLT